MRPTGQRSISMISYRASGGSADRSRSSSGTAPGAGSFCASRTISAAQVAGEQQVHRLPPRSSRRSWPQPQRCVRGANFGIRPARRYRSWICRYSPRFAVRRRRYATRPRSPSTIATVGPIQADRSADRRGLCPRYLGKGFSPDRRRSGCLILVTLDQRERPGWEAMARKPFALILRGPRQPICPKVSTSWRSTARTAWRFTSFRSSPRRPHQDYPDRLQLSCPSVARREDPLPSNAIIDRQKRHAVLVRYIAPAGPDRAGPHHRSRQAGVAVDVFDRIVGLDPVAAAHRPCRLAGWSLRLFRESYACGSEPGSPAADAFS